MIDPQADSRLKRRRIVRFGTLITALTGASAMSAVGASAAPGDKTPTNAYVPTLERGAAGGVGIPAVTILIPGTLRITRTILISQKGVTLSGRGIGNPSNFRSSPSAASVIRWDGTAGTPMFIVTDARFVSVENMLICSIGQHRQG